MDIPKIVEFLDQYPPWFKVGLVVVSALVVLGFLTLRQPRSTALSAPPTSAQPSVGGPGSDGASLTFATPRTLVDFFESREALDGRFLELEDFSKRLMGQPVVWEGVVASVSDQSLTSDFPILMIVTTGEGRVPSVAGVNLPESLRTKAYALRKGDRVRFTGVISTASSTPYVKAEKIDLVHSRSGS